MWVGSLFRSLVLGPLLVLAYNLELFGGFVHTDIGFALAWGSFPVLVAYVAQTGRLSIAPLIAAREHALFLSLAQRSSSTPARLIRRRVTSVDGHATLRDGGTISIDQQSLLAPLEGALRAMSWGVVLTAAAFAVARLT